MTTGRGNSQISIPLVSLTLPVYSAPLRLYPDYIPTEFRNSLLPRKLQDDRSVRLWKNFDNHNFENTFSHLDTIPERHNHTDGQTKDSQPAGKNYGIRSLIVEKKQKKIIFRWGTICLLGSKCHKSSATRFPLLAGEILTHTWRPSVVCCHLL